jgi:tetratricopeptide (TPR) repeat protein
MGHYQLRDYEKSIEFFNKDLNFIPTNEKYALILMYNGSSLFELQRYDEAIRTLKDAERACVDKNNLPFIRANLGMAYFAKNEYSNALPYLQAAQPAYPFLAEQINHCLAKNH